MRLDKYLADMGIGTRSEIKKDIKSGRVSVDGIIIRDPGCKVSADSRVMINGNAVAYEEYVYYMLNKPAGVISASEDPRQETVIDLIDEQKRRDLFPAGRLDKDTEGLMLITNDGTLAHRLLSPKHHVDKTYFARVLEDVTDEDAEAFREGLVLPDGLECMPAEVTVTGRFTAADFMTSAESFMTPHDQDALSDEGYMTPHDQAALSVDDPDAPVTEVLITIREGKFHQIKRMFHAIGCEVIYLKRLTMGTLELDPDLAPGEYRRLTDEELDSLLKL